MKVRPKLIQLLTLPKIAVYAGLFWMALFLMCGIWLLDIGIISTFIQAGQLSQLGFNLILCCVSLIVGARISFLLLRRQGYGCVPVCTFFLFLCVVLLMFAEGSGLNFLFIFKYALFTVLISSLWGVVKRFGSIGFTEILAKVVIAGQLAGCLAAGVLVRFIPDGYLILWTGFGILCLFLLALKRVVVLHPVPSENFIKKTSRVAKNEHKQLMIYLYYVSFFCWAGKALMDFVLIDRLALFNGTIIISVLGLLALCFGLIGCAALYFFSKVSYLSTLFWGMQALPAVLGVAAISVWHQMPGLLFLSYLLWNLLLFFYYVPFVKIIPQILAYTHKTYFAQVRLFWIEPVGFLAGAVGAFLIENETELGGCLLCCAGLLWLFLLAVLHRYNVLLKRVFDLQIYREGYFILTPSLLKKIRLELKKTTAPSLIYVIDFLKKAMHPLADEYLRKGLKDTDERVVLFCLQQIEGHSAGLLFFKDLLKLFDRTDSMQIKNKALALIIEQKYRSSSSNGLNAYVPFLENSALLEGTLIGFLRVGGNYTLLATQKLQRLADSKKNDKKLQVLRIIQKAPYPAFYKLVEQLLKQNQPEIVREALRAAGSLKTPKLLPLIFKALEDVTLQEEALNTLKSFGKRAFPPLEKMLMDPHVPLLCRKQLVLFLGFLPSGEGKQILIRALSDSSAELRALMIRTLLDSGIFWMTRGRKILLKKQIDKDLNRISFLKKQQEKYILAPVPSAQEAFDFIRSAIREEIRETYRLILSQLMLLYRHPLFAKAVRLLLKEDLSQKQLALAAMQDFMPVRFYKKLHAVLFSDTPIQKVSLSPQEAVQALSELIRPNSFSLSIWLRSCVLYALRRLNVPEGKEVVCVALSDPNPLVFEAAIWALAHLEKDKKLLHQRLLSAPTSALAGPALESILNDI